MSDFSPIQMALFNFFEFKVSETSKICPLNIQLRSDLRKIRIKIEEKNKANDQEEGVDKEKIRVELDELIAKQKSLRNESLKTLIPEWLSECAMKAEWVGKPMVKVTHPVKFVHGITPYGGIYIPPNASNDECLVTTDKMARHHFDIVMSNGNLITHGRFLLSELNGKTVYQALEHDDYDWLSEFSTDEAQIEQWAIGLKNWLGESAAMETSRLKQIYFYNPKSDGYVLLSPLLSSALVQSLYEKIRFFRFDRENSLRRKARKNSKYVRGELVTIPNVAIMNFGGTQPQNISVRNFERHGEAYLLPCTPPKWHTILKPPINQNSIFQGEFNHRAWHIAKDLRDFLIDLHQDQNNMRIRKHVKQKVNQIIDVLLNYASQIQSLKTEQGWSSRAPNLKLEHKLWLDMSNEDKVFQGKRREGEWISVVCKDFGLWLNNKLDHKRAAFDAIESRHWAKLLERKLKMIECREHQI